MALLGAWRTQATGRPLLGMDQRHLYDDAKALALLGIFLLLDGHIHTAGDDRRRSHTP